MPKKKCILFLSNSRTSVYIDFIYSDLYNTWYTPWARCQSITQEHTIIIQHNTIEQAHYILGIVAYAQKSLNKKRTLTHPAGLHV